MLETSTTLAESEKYHRDLQSLTLIPSYREKEVVVISKEIVASPAPFSFLSGRENTLLVLLSEFPEFPSRSIALKLPSVPPTVVIAAWGYAIVVHVA
jgi:hypothetical protein